MARDPLQPRSIGSRHQPLGSSIILHVSPRSAKRANLNVEHSLRDRARQRVASASFRFGSQAHDPRCPGVHAVRKRSPSYLPPASAGGKSSEIIGVRGCRWACRWIGRINGVRKYGSTKYEAMGVDGNPERPNPDNPEPRQPRPLQLGAAELRDRIARRQSIRRSPWRDRNAVSIGPPKNRDSRRTETHRRDGIELL